MSKEHQKSTRDSMRRAHQANQANQAHQANQANQANQAMQEGAEPTPAEPTQNVGDYTLNSQQSQKQPSQKGSKRHAQEARERDSERVSLSRTTQSPSNTLQESARHQSQVQIPTDISSPEGATLSPYPASQMRHLKSKAEQEGAEPYQKHSNQSAQAQSVEPNQPSHEVGAPYQTHPIHPIHPIQAKHLNQEPASQPLNPAKEPIKPNQPSQEPIKPAPRLLGVCCYRYIGKEPMLQWYGAEATRLKYGDTIIVPKGSLSIELSYKKAIYEPCEAF